MKVKAYELVCQTRGSLTRRGCVLSCSGVLARTDWWKPELSVLLLRQGWEMEKNEGQ